MPRIEIRITHHDDTVNVVKEWEEVSTVQGGIIRGELTPELAYQIMGRALAGIGLKEGN